MYLKSRFINDQLLKAHKVVKLDKPKQSKEVTKSMLSGVASPVALLGVRGYFSKTFSPEGNNIGVYDDAIFLISDYGYYPFNANTDPSVLRPRVARLKAGTWQYKLGIHNISKSKNRQYPALIQAAPVTVSRVGTGDDTGWFGINIHKGSNNSTSSEGCQTIPPSQWSSFYELTRMEMKRAGVKIIPYVLVDNSQTWHKNAQ